jgi:hypothetical protein
MARAKTPRATKPKAENNVLHMPENSGNGAAISDLESQIRLRAYEIYAERGYTNGRAEQDWYEAEQQVRTRHTNKHTA